jgi:hypothetical protein
MAAATKAAPYVIQPYFPTRMDGVSQFVSQRRDT